MASIFKKRILKERLENFEIPNFEAKLAIIKQWHDAYQNGSLKKKTEKEIEQEFIHSIFVEVLEYTRFPDEPYTIQPQGKTQTSGQKPDAILGSFSSDKEITKVAAVCEIKDVNTALDKSQRREGSLTPVQQAFKYKTQYKSCDFVIATNFYEVRLLKDNELNFEQWTLESLVNPENNYFEFRKFYYLLCQAHLVVSRGKSKTLQLLADIQVEQEKITKDFYKLYKELRQKLIKNIMVNNPEAKKKENFYNLTVEKAQKIIDRLVFVAFCEDLGLLPENILLKVIESDNNTFSSTWDTLKGFFNAVDTGSPKLNNAQGYNGELFKPDKDLDSLVIDDEICREFLKIGQYDFSEDLSVNILGHIFEQSISDLEELKAIGEDNKTDKKKSKRKKDGIFYTPEYIVDYIVENAVGAWLKERETEIMAKHGVKEDIQDNNYNKRLLEALKDYQQVLQNIKVLDPACGSGAFLVRVFDFLLAENKRVASLIAEQQGGAMSLFDTEQAFKDILQNNIYGVDLNQESVEITKLSLWLKTAQKGKKLASLYNNIKCGNSLIDDPAVAGNKAFKWQDEFKEIMDEGGFDVIVGNPPYVSNKNDSFNQSIKAYLTQVYCTAEYQIDTYILFIEKGTLLLKSFGNLAYIIPNTWMNNLYLKQIRKFLLEKTGIKEICVMPSNAFEQATVDTIILALKPSKIGADISIKQCTNYLFSELHKIPTQQFKDNEGMIFDIYTDPLSKKILNKCESSCSHINDLFETTRGVNPYDKYRGQSKEIISSKAYHAETKKDNTFVPLLLGKNLHRWEVQWDGKSWISYGPWLAAPREPKFFDGERIVIRKIPAKNRLVSAVMNKKMVTDQSIYIALPKSNISLFYIASILNSILMGFYFKYKFSEFDNVFPQIKVSHFNALPIKLPTNDGKCKIIESKGRNMHLLHEDQVNKVSTFINLIKTEYESKWPRSLNEFWNLEFKDLLKKLKLTKLSLTEKDDLLQLWNKYIPQLQELDAKIQKLDQEIDEMVFDLYELTPEERQIVLDSTSD